MTSTWRMKRHGRVNVRALPRAKSPLNVLPPRKPPFGPPLVPSRVHWVKPKLVAEITYLTWTGEGLLRQTVCVGLHEDKPQSRCGEKLHGLSRRKRTRLDQRKTVQSRREADNPRVHRRCVSIFDAGQAPMAMSTI
jgi:ATP dependent DNA ligase C terminal region